VTITNWKTLISEEMTNQNESWDDLCGNTLTEEEMCRRFDHGHKAEPEGIPFTLWTRFRVYFPLVYDGAEWVGSVPRHTCMQKIKHLGG
jgi:hypothetical protein